MVQGTLTPRHEQYEQYEQIKFALSVLGAGLRSHTARVRVAPCSTGERALVLQRDDTDPQ